MPFTIVISGAGSIGSRHATNLKTLGIENVTLCDPSVESADYSDLEEAITKENPNVVFICSPSKLHIKQALLAAKQNCHLFIEKPLSHTLDGIDELKKEVAKRNLTCMVGCNMRFHPGPKRVKEELERGDIGDIKTATVYTGSYLPDWRPQQDYKKSYSADLEQGGALLDCIHEIDLALWYFGEATLKEATLKPATTLGIDVEGTADLTLEHASGCTSHVHLSFMEKEYRRFCDIEGIKGKIHWDIAKDSSDFNQCYIDEITYFLECIEKNQIPMGNLKEAEVALRIALEAKKRTVD